MMMVRIEEITNPNLKDGKNNFRISQHNKSITMYRVTISQLVPISWIACPIV